MQPYNQNEDIQMNDETGPQLIPAHQHQQFTNLSSIVTDNIKEIPSMVCEDFKVAEEELKNNPNYQSKFDKPTETTVDETNFQRLFKTHQLVNQCRVNYPQLTVDGRGVLPKMIRPDKNNKPDDYIFELQEQPSICAVTKSAEERVRFVSMFQKVKHYTYVANPATGKNVKGRKFIVPNYKEYPIGVQGIHNNRDIVLEMIQRIGQACLTGKAQRLFDQAFRYDDMKLKAVEEVSKFSSLCEQCQSLCDGHLTPKAGNHRYGHLVCQFVQTVAPRNVLSNHEHILSFQQHMECLKDMQENLQSQYEIKFIQEAIKVMNNQYTESKIHEESKNNDQRKTYQSNGYKFRQQHINSPDIIMCAPIFGKNRNERGFHNMIHALSNLDQTVDRTIEGHPHCGLMIYETIKTHPQQMIDYAEQFASGFTSHCGHIDAEHCAPQTLFLAGKYETPNQTQILENIQDEDIKTNIRKNPTFLQSYVNTFKSNVSELTGEISLASIAFIDRQSYRQSGKTLEQTIVDTLVNYINQTKQFAPNPNQQARNLSFREWHSQQKFGAIVSFIFQSAPHYRFNMCTNLQIFRELTKKGKSKHSRFYLKLKDSTITTLLKDTKLCPSAENYQTDTEYLQNHLYKFVDEHKLFTTDEVYNLKPTSEKDQKGLPKKNQITDFTGLDKLEKIFIQMFQRTFKVKDCDETLCRIQGTIQIERVSLHTLIKKEMTIQDTLDLPLKFIMRMIALSDKWKDCRIGANGWSSRKFIQMLVNNDPSIFKCYLNERNMGIPKISNVSLQKYNASTQSDAVQKQVLDLKIDGRINFKIFANLGKAQVTQLQELMNTIDCFENLPTSTFMTLMAGTFNSLFEKNDKAQQRINHGINNYIQWRMLQLNDCEQILAFYKDFALFLEFRKTGNHLPMFLISGEYAYRTKQQEIAVNKKQSHVELLTKPLLYMSISDFRSAYPYYIGKNLVQPNKLLITSPSLHLVFRQLLRQVIFDFHQSKNVPLTFHDLCYICKTAPIEENFLYYFGLIVDCNKKNITISPDQQQELNDGLYLSNVNVQSMTDDVNPKFYWQYMIITAYCTSVDLADASDRDKLLEVSFFVQYKIQKAKNLIILFEEETKSEQEPRQNSKSALQTKPKATVNQKKAIKNLITSDLVQNTETCGTMEEAQQQLVTLMFKNKNKVFDIKEVQHGAGSRFVVFEVPNQTDPVNYDQRITLETSANQNQNQVRVPKDTLQVIHQYESLQSGISKKQKLLYGTDKAQ